MPASHKSNRSPKYLKYLTIIAIVLFAVITLCVIVVEIARRDVEDMTGNVNLKLASITFDSDSIVTLKFRAIPDPHPITQSACWSLAQWRVTSIEIHPDAYVDISRMFETDVKAMEEIKRLRDSELFDSERPLFSRR